MDPISSLALAVNALQLPRVLGKIRQDNDAIRKVARRNATRNAKK